MMWRQFITHLSSNHTLNCVPHNINFESIYSCFLVFFFLLILVSIAFFGIVLMYFLRMEPKFSMWYFFTLTTQSKRNDLFVQEAFIVIKYGNFMRWNCSFFAHIIAYTGQTLSIIWIKREKINCWISVFKRLTFIFVHLL